MKTILVIAAEAVTVCDCTPLVCSTENSLPHFGLLAFVRADEVEKLFGSETILLTHQPDRF